LNSKIFKCPEYLKDVIGFQKMAVMGLEVWLTWQYTCPQKHETLSSNPSPTKNKKGYLLIIDLNFLRGY
jgi:hypothetical protein